MWINEQQYSSSLKYQDNIYIKNNSPTDNTVQCLLYVMEGTLEFQKFKTYKKWLRANILSTCGNCVRMFIIQQGTMVVLMPTGHHRSQFKKKKKIHYALYKQHHLLLFKSIGRGSVGRISSPRAFVMLDSVSKQVGECFKIKLEML